MKDVIHIVEVSVVENYRHLNTQTPMYDDWMDEDHFAVRSFEGARKAAKMYLKSLFAYLGNDWMLEFEDHETEIVAIYNGGYVGQAIIEYVYCYTTAKEVFES